MKLSKLKFVDSKRYKRGVDMDVKMQLLTLALRPGQKPDSKLIAKAVDDAGYVAVEWYTMDTGKLKTHPFPVRSEERRVGKEWRSRREPEQ